MSRSIHTTRRDLEEELLWDPRGKRADRLREQLRRKRSIKWSVYEQRHTPPLPGPTSADGLPVRELESAPYITYGASEEDIREVLRRLPPGTLDGIAGVDLTLARDAQWDEGDADPYTGRIGIESVPGLWRISLAGSHFPRGGQILLVGTVVDPEHPLRDLLATHLRLRSLCTLVHEVAHHVDHKTRVGRGRWRADEEEKVERYAEERELAWTREVVIPYLNERYAEDVERLLGWIERRGGVRVSLATLAGDPTNPMEIGWTFGGAFERLLECVLQGMDPVDARTEFADELWLCDLHDELATVLDGILAEQPGDHRALLLRSRLLEARDQPDDAEALVRGVLAEAAENVDAWSQLADLQEARYDWAGVAGSATRVIQLTSQEGSRAKLALAQRARALFALGRLSEMGDDLQLLTGPLGEPLRASWLLHVGRPSEALVLAKAHMARSRLWLRRNPELAAVRFEAAAQLGRPHDGGELTEEILERMREKGFGDWADRLADPQPAP